MNDEAVTRLLCLHCATETTSATAAASGGPGCPTCGNTSIPADLDDILTVALTRHELRILTFWASNYATAIGCPEVTRTILDRLAPQTDASLSWSQELADLRAKMPESDIIVYRGGEVVDE
jgi:hypothetical protein